MSNAGKISGIKPKIGEYLRFKVYLPFICVLISYYIFERGNLFHTNVDSARYMLSALMQSEAAILAIVISLSLVAVQLTHTYFPRVTEILTYIRGLWLLVIAYIFAILYTSCVLKMIKPNPGSYLEAHNSIYCFLDISSCYFLGVFCLTALIPYTIYMFTKLKPSTIIKDLSQKITKDTGLAIGPIQQIMDLVRGSIMRYDYETARKGLEEVKERICALFKNEELTEEEKKKISRKTCEYFSRIGKLLLNTEYGDLALELISNIKEIEETAAEYELVEASLETILSLGEIGMAAVEKLLEKVAFETAYYLGEIGMAAVDKGFKETVREATKSLGEIGKAAVKKDLEEEVWEVFSILRRIGMAAIEKESRKAGGKAAYYLGEIGMAAVEKLLEEEARESARIPKRIGMAAVEKGFEETVREVATSLGEVGKAAVEKEFEKSAREAAYYLGEIGIAAAEGGFAELIKLIASSLGEIGIAAAEGGFGWKTWEVLSILGEIGIIMSINDSREGTEEVVSILRRIRMIALKRSLRGEAKEITLILEKIERNRRKQFLKEIRRSK